MYHGRLTAGVTRPLSDDSYPKEETVFCKQLEMMHDFSCGLGDGIGNLRTHNEISVLISSWNSGKSSGT